jgi:hypothetical protein
MIHLLVAERYSTTATDQIRIVLAAGDGHQVAIR